VIIKLKGVQKSYEHVNEWVNGLMKRHDYRDNNDAFALLKATLCTLRDRLPVDEAIHLGAQLPVLLRGYYYEGWDNNKNPIRHKTAEDFFNAIRKHMQGHENVNLETAVPTVMKFIFDKIDRGEAEDVIGNLPKDIQHISN
jgi:uncharacterized protein (DUF2267 family)